MAKYFLGSVGKAEAFRMINGVPHIAFVSKTLTDSGLNISTTKDDIRGGQGAPVQFSFYHDANVEITLTDVLFKREYVEAQLGAEFKANGAAYQSEKVAAEAEGTIKLSKLPINLPLGCGNAPYKGIWFAEEGSDVWSMAEGEITPPASGESKYTVSGLTGIEEGKTYCIRYLANDDKALVAQITANIIPEELFLIITAPIFAGDACAASNGKQAGTITFEVPRFRLNGNQDFAMAMSSNQTMSLSGTAMAGEGGCGNDGADLLKIIEVIDNRSIVKTVIDDDGCEWNVYSDGSVARA